MAPLLPDGSVATLRPVRDKERLYGAIVAIEIGQQVVVHRVALETENAIATRGIASPKFDPPVPKSAVIGVVCERSGLALSESALGRGAGALSIAYRGLRALARRPQA